MAMLNNQRLNNQRVAFPAISQDPPFLMGKSTISMAIFNSYFDITRGYPLLISISSTPRVRHPKKTGRETGAGHAFHAASSAAMDDEAVPATMLGTGGGLAPWSFT